eukprot:1728264-Rhodomonas_salina.4
MAAVALGLEAHPGLSFARAEVAALIDAPGGVHVELNARQEREIAPLHRGPRNQRQESAFPAAFADEEGGCLSFNPRWRSTRAGARYAVSEEPEKKTWALWIQTLRHIGAHARARASTHGIAPTSSRQARTSPHHVASRTTRTVSARDRTAVIARCTWTSPMHVAAHRNTVSPWWYHMLGVQSRAQASPTSAKSTAFSVQLVPEVWPFVFDFAVVILRLENSAHHEIGHVELLHLQPLR